MPNVIDFMIYKEYGELAEPMSFHQHLEDVAIEYPDSFIEDVVMVAAYRSRQ